MNVQPEQAKNNAKQPVFHYRTSIPEIEFRGNIEKSKALIKNGDYEAAANVVRDNGFMPDFLIADLTKFAPDGHEEDGVVGRLLADYKKFLLNKLTTENVEFRGKRISGLLRALARQNGRSYFNVKCEIVAAVQAVGGKLPTIVVETSADIENAMRYQCSKEDWLSFGFEVKVENEGQIVYAHPFLKINFTVYKQRVGPQSEAEKAKERDRRESDRRSRQLNRAAAFPGKVGGGGGGGKKEEGKGKKK